MEDATFERIANEALHPRDRDEPHASNDGSDMMNGASRIGDSITRREPIGADAI
jgi:hypothetical protein